MNRKTFVLLWFLLPLLSGAATTNKISQWGITWQFSASHEYGQFANGDFWVVGPVTITAMSPDWTGTKNGWEVDPVFSGSQGFHAAGTAYSSAKRPALPLTVNGGSTVVKTIGGADSGSYDLINTAAALTVLSSAPPDGTGAGYFRPPYSYTGGTRPMIPISQLQTSLLPSLPAVSGAPTLAAVNADFSKCLRMDHHAANPRQFRPLSGFNDDYQPKNTIQLNEAMLRLMLNDSISAKMPALIQFTQHALDRAYIITQGYRRRDNGHNPNHRILAAWAAKLLDLEDVETYLGTASDFQEDRYLYQGINAVLWGEPSSEQAYWDYINGLGGGRSYKDPYNYIDGGAQGPVGASYQNITSQSLKGQALVCRLFPQLQSCFPALRWNNLNKYAQRWVAVGTWTKPDPHNRYVSLHGSNRDGGQYKSSFVAAMWNAYANSGGVSVNAGVDQQIALPNNSVSLSGTYTAPEGETVTAAWTKVNGPGTVTFTAPSAAGTVATFSQSGTYTLRLTATASSASESDDVVVTLLSAPDLTPPTGALTAPIQGQSVSNVVTFTATATDNPGGSGVASVSFLVNGTVVATDTTAPFSVTWDSRLVQNGSHTIQATAQDAAGNQASSATVTVQVQNPLPDLGSGLVGHWSFNEMAGLVAHDSSGNRNDGALLTEGQWSAGVLKGALGFSSSGSLNRVDLGSIDVPGSLLTLAAWIKVNSVNSQDPRIIARATGTAMADMYWVLEIDEDPEDSSFHHFGFRVNSGGSVVRLTGGTVPIGEWVHLAGVYDGNSMKLYVNGQLVTSAPKTGSIRTGGASVWVGDAPPSGSRAFDGLIDEVRIYSRAISPSEAQTLAAITVPPSRLRRVTSTP